MSAEVQMGLGGINAVEVGFDLSPLFSQQGDAVVVGDADHLRREAVLRPRGNANTKRKTRIGRR